MLTYIRENRKYILFLLFVWIIATAWILPNRYHLLNRLALIIQSPGYDPKTAKEFIKKGDSILAKEVTYQDLGERIPDLNVMREACLYYYSLSEIDRVLYKPSWTDSMSTWRFKTEEESEDKKNSTKTQSRSPITGSFNPGDYWKVVAPNVLEALDYYKRALNFSGPDLNVPKKIEKTALAVCRPEEVLLAYADYIRNTEETVRIVMEKTQKPKSFFSCNQTEEQPNVLTEKQNLMRIWSQIKSNSFVIDPDQNLKVNANDFKKALNILAFGIYKTGLNSISPIEADGVLEKLLFFSDPNTIEYDELLMKRGMLNYQLGKRDPIFFDKAIFYFRESSKSTYLDKGSVFESRLMIVRSEIRKGQLDPALLELQQLETELYTIDKAYRVTGRGRNDLLEDRKKLLRYILRKKGRYEEADELYVEEDSIL
ncbi:hypothetical protein RBB68_08350 [Leptospira interrogans]|uniref:Uncharacterized protein n=7 Tax=Leptospira interrogans TaxID=173 RepID=A0AAP9WCM7_LEPIR|nr:MULTISPECIES: hypothetical protein [Leptospira]EMF44555.1 hypothetical protein LEP1GSC067_3672 [Leptospira interrogans serovar Lora str. TE 1992]EMP05099.1 hypothetical protein LEP1GSC124_2329 [Leptospira interrogans serovar Pyrogenes str. 200701872]AAS70259.1 conserved hypothetical protein [Leptospira interrogans serovar Copenhageni str. Fiocruz L1-130]AJR14391.1 hypothetical protein LIL_11789 [Leptospira interrogans serovar Linhai str. 56609]AKH77183.1 hypothetical protein BRAT_09035 [Lep